MIGELLFAILWAASLITTLLFVGARMFCVGLSVHPGELGAALRDRGFLARALAANVVIVPGLGIAIARTLPLPPEVAAALVLVAAVGGGIDYLAPRDRPAGAPAGAAALVWLLSAVSILLTPAIHALLLPPARPTGGVPWRAVVIVGLGALVPLVAGLLVRRRSPSVADVLGRALAVVALVLLVAAALTTFLPVDRDLVALGVPAGLAMALLVTVAGATGWLLGGPSRGGRALLAGVTAMRNGGLGLLLAIATFPDAGVDVAVLLFVVVAAGLRALARVAHRATAGRVAVSASRTREP